MSFSSALMIYAHNFIRSKVMHVQTHAPPFQPKSNWSGSLRYRYMQDLTANEDDSIVAQGYMVFDAVVYYIAFTPDTPFFLKASAGYYF